MLCRFITTTKALCYLLVFWFSLSCVAQSTSDIGEIQEKSPPNHLVLSHQNVELAQLSLNQLRSIFSLRARRWQNGSAIKVVVLEDEHPVHRDFSRLTLKMLPHQLRRHWDRYIYSGTGQGPIVVKSQKEMVAMLKRTPGSIGYVEKGVTHDQLHAITIR